MKNIRDLGITTKEGFSVKNLKRFPSMEWGEEGGLTADLYYKGAKILSLYQEGNGGSAMATYNEMSLDIKRAALDFLKRCDKAYDTYEFLIRKTAKDINDDDFEAVINCIEERYDIIKNVKKAFKKDYKSVAVLGDDLRFDYLQYRVSDITLDEVKTYLKKNKLDKKYFYIQLYKITDDLTIM